MLLPSYHSYFAGVYPIPKPPRGEIYIGVTVILLSIILFVISYVLFLPEFRNSLQYKTAGISINVIVIHVCVSDLRWNFYYCIPATIASCVDTKVTQIQGKEKNFRVEKTVRHL